MIRSKADHPRQGDHLDDPDDPDAQFRVDPPRLQRLPLVLGVVFLSEGIWLGLTALLSPPHSGHVCFALRYGGFCGDYSPGIYYFVFLPWVLSGLALGSVFLWAAVNRYVRDMRAYVQRQDSNA